MNLYHDSGHFCPVCERESKTFLAFGHPLRHAARCPHCGSLERHRLAWIFFQSRTDLLDGRPKRMLHIAPEACFATILKAKLAAGYLTADINAAGVMEQMDITNISYPSETFDIIYCSHVLEHVPDDRRALAEFARVLSRHGWAVLLVPITVDETFEDLRVTDPSERRRLFGQEDHVRRYGRDYVDRLVDAGFVVEQFTRYDLVPSHQLKRLGLESDATGDIFYCRKG